MIAEAEAPPRGQGARSGRGVRNSGKSGAMANERHPFDRRALRRRRDRAAAGFTNHRFLFDAVARDLVERLGAVRRRFATALDLGCRDGFMARALGAGDRVDVFVNADLSPAMAARAPRPALAADEEALPFCENAFDLVTGVLSLHWVNDLPGALVQIRRILRPDGMALLALFGAGTLRELRIGLARAEIETGGGAGARVSPFPDVRTAGSLLQRAGFALPVVDESTVPVRFADAARLFADLRGMGETNALAARPRGPLRRAALDRFLSAAPVPYETGFSVITLTGWKPAPGQPRPRPPGSAARRLADALGPPDAPASRRHPPIPRALRQDD